MTPFNDGNLLSINYSITFERVPSDYAILKIIKTPEDVGGDTLWASGYEAFDRLSPVWQRFAEGLTATHHQVSSFECM
jgi:alpha-ketoglutarate-dependent taurine dioxygenase